MSTTNSACNATARLLLSGLAIAMVAGPAAGQLLPPPGPPAMPKTLPMHSVLYDAEQLARTQPDLSVQELRVELDRHGLVLDESGLVHVEIVGPEGADALPAEPVEQSGGRVDQTFANRMDAWLPLDRLTGFASALPDGWVLERVNSPVPDAVLGQGPAAIASLAYANGGSNGAGIGIAIIDGVYSGLTMAENQGDAPAGATRIDLTPGPFESGGTHGTGCVEAAFDHAPGANYRLYRVDSATDLGVAMFDAANAGIDVTSESQSWFNTGWNDDSGGACLAANVGTGFGMICCYSAGNYAQHHWQGNFIAGAGASEWHDWVNGDEANAVVVQDGDQVTFWLSWDTAGGTFDYDLFLYDASVTNELASSESGGNTYEQVTWMNNTGQAQTVHVAIWNDAGGAVTEFQLFGSTIAGFWEHRVTASSVTSPSNTTHPNVISVAAVPWANYGQAAGTNPIANYSSNGPSNGGMTLPDLSGPTNTTGFTYPAGFGGTSCATPNVAGAIAAFWSDEPQLDASGVRWLMFEQARLWRDWGAGGNDNVYGQGGAFLINFVPNTTWVARSFGNTGNLTNGPFYTVQAGHNAAVNGGRLVIFRGGSYPEPATLTKVLDVRAVGGVAQVGH